MLTTHQICRSCLGVKRIAAGLDTSVEIYLRQISICCWCGLDTNVMLFGSAETPAQCPGHGWDQPWGLADYARAVISEYRLGRAGQGGDHEPHGICDGQKEHRYAPVDILRETTLNEAINALEEELT